MRVLYADAALIVVDKPAGLLSVPGRGPDRQDCAARRVQALHTDALVVHRLDMATSGLLLLARGAMMQRELSRAFAERSVHKTYLAAVGGAVAGEAGEIDLPLAADWPNRPRQQVDRLHGKASLTRWRVVGRGEGVTRLALEPVTGRSHQLRVHLAAIGHPIVGDTLYAGATAPRLMLHATRLSLAPMAGLVRVDFESKVPF